MTDRADLNFTLELENHLLLLIEGILDDDHGISADAFDRLMDLLSYLREFDDSDRFARLFSLANAAHATEGRYYLPSLEEC